MSKEDNDGLVLTGDRSLFGTRRSGCIHQTVEALTEIGAIKIASPDVLTYF